MTDFTASSIIHPAWHSMRRHNVRKINVIVFNKNGEVLGVKRGRALDVIKGRQEWDDDTHEDAARRETYEQANVMLGAVTLAAVIETPCQMGNALTYEYVMTGIAQVGSVCLHSKGSSASFFDKNVFLKRYRSDASVDMRMLIYMAELNHSNIHICRKSKHVLRRAADPTKKTVGQIALNTFLPATHLNQY